MMQVLRPARHAFRRPYVLTVLALVLGAVAAPPVSATTLFDFEGPFLRDPTRTIKDHSMVFDGTDWHCFYIRGDEDVPGTSSERELGHAVTSNLRSWTLLPSALTSDTGTWDGRNVWAPQVLPSIGGNGWTMFYTGVESNLLQRMGRADSPDLLSWTKSAENPLLSPDPAIYMWSANLPVPSLSAFRDPFVFEYQGQYHVLHTALVPDAGVSAGRRGVIHHAVSDDLVNFTELAPLVVSNTNQGVWREIESVQLIQNGGKWHLFFTLFGITGVQWVRNDSFDTGWNLANAAMIDAGIAAEITPIGNGDYLFTRHAADVHFVQHPDAGQLFYTLRADTLRFSPSNAPVIVRNGEFAQKWPEREGNAFLYAPTFGDNQRERGEYPVNLVGNSYLSSREFWQGPLSGLGGPGGTIGAGATGRIRSQWFAVDAHDLEYDFLIAGTGDPGCRVELLERVEVAPGSFEVIVRRSEIAPDAAGMVPRRWNVVDLRGATVRLEVIDESETSWISLDHFRAVRDSVVTQAPTATDVRGVLHAPAPNPFNPRTTLRFDLPRAGVAALEIFDLRGRRVRALDLGDRPTGTHAVTWDARDGRGVELSSGVYLVRLLVDGVAVDARKAVLAR